MRRKRSRNVRRGSDLRRHQRERHLYLLRVARIKLVLKDLAALDPRQVSALRHWTPCRRKCVRGLNESGVHELQKRGYAIWVAAEGIVRLLQLLPAHNRAAHNGHWR